MNASVIIKITFVQNSSADVAELTAALSETNTRIQELETEHAAELESQKKQAHKTDKKLTKLQSAYDKLEAEKRDLESQLKVAKETAEAELKQKDEVSIFYFMVMSIYYK